ncbi:MAG: nitroreductase family protein [Lachnospiraceae bacterium]|nr:nitroreductase family protein [Lachnospiraceae bacterium]
MDTIKNILTRKSVRKFTDREISMEDIHTILTAGMSGPSCVNARQWSFLVVTDKEKLNQMADANGKPADPLRNAAMGILVCGDLKRSFPPAPDYWVIDASIAAQNMILAAHDLGIGSVWLGTWPQMERVKKQAELFELPDHIVPHSVVAFGYPENEEETERNLYEEDRVHFDRW